MLWEGAGQGLLQVFLEPLPQTAARAPGFQWSQRLAGRFPCGRSVRPPGPGLPAVVSVLVQQLTPGGGRETQSIAKTQK